MISKSRNRGKVNPNFIAYAFEIKPEIKDLPDFVSNDEVNKMNVCAISSEVLYKGEINDKLFANPIPLPVRLKHLRSVQSEIESRLPIGLRRELTLDEAIANTFEKMRQINI